MARRKQIKKAQVYSRIVMDPNIHEGLRTYYRLHKTQLEAEGIQSLYDLINTQLFKLVKDCMPLNIIKT